MATNSLSPHKHSFKLVGNHAVIVLARRAAGNAVKDQLRAEGARVTLIPPRVVAEKAQRYLADHPELYEQARERAVRMGFIPPALAETNS
jgi:hypothetical protein